MAELEKVPAILKERESNPQLYPSSWKVKLCRFLTATSENLFRYFSLFGSDNFTKIIPPENFQKKLAISEVRVVAISQEKLTGDINP